LAFYPVNSRPFSVLLESIWSYYKNSQVYFWRRQRDIVYKGEQVTGVNSYTNIPSQEGESGLSSLSRRLELEVLKEENSQQEKQSSHG